MKIGNIISNRFVKRIAIPIAVIALVVIMGAVITNRDNNHDNFKLSESQKAVQDSIQKNTKRNDIKYVKETASSDNWKIVQTNLTKQRNNYSYTILKGNTVIAGPGTSFSLDSLWDSGAPDNIVSYFYPDKPWWPHFEEKLSFDYPNNIKYIEAAIQSMAILHNIDLQSAAITSNLTRNKTTNGMYVETFSFKFIVNRKDTYTFHGRYGSDTFRMTFEIRDSNNNIVYTAS